MVSYKIAGDPCESYSTMNPADFPPSFVDDAESIPQPPFLLPGRRTSVSDNVDRACFALRDVEVPVECYQNRATWIPPLPIDQILKRVVRPSVFILQRALDPTFSGDGGIFHLPDCSYRQLQRSFMKILQLLVCFSVHPYPWFSRSDSVLFIFLKRCSTSLRR